MKKREKLKKVIELNNSFKDIPELNIKLSLNKETITRLNNNGMEGANNRGISFICSPFPLTTWTVTCICPDDDTTWKYCSVSKYTYCVDGI